MPERLAESRIHKQGGGGGVSMVTLKAATNWHRHNERIGGSNLPDPYLPRDQQPAHREGKGQESTKIRKYTLQMIRNDQLATQHMQCNKIEKPCKSLECHPRSRVR